MKKNFAFLGKIMNNVIFIFILGIWFVETKKNVQSVEVCFVFWSKRSLLGSISLSRVDASSSNLDGDKTSK